MTLQYCSDLHLEFKENCNYIKTHCLQVKGDILILAGDVVPFALMSKHDDFFNYVSDHFACTYWLPGNHEYYHSDLSLRSGSFLESIRKNVFLINDITVEHESNKLIFSTLWSSINPANRQQIERGMNDFHVIRFDKRRFSAAEFNQLHEHSLHFIKEELDNPADGKTVVITHHVPTFENYPVQYKTSVLNQAFAVDLGPLISQSGPDYWIYGHIHNNTPDFTIGKTRLITNQLGYVHCNEHGLFQPDKFIIL